TCLLGAVALAIIMIAQYLVWPDATLVSVMYYPLFFVAIQMAAYIPAHKNAVRLKSENKWLVSDSVFAETKSSHSRGTLRDLPWVWYLCGLVVVLAGAAAALIRYPALPDRIPIHFDANMQPNDWANKSPGAALMLPLVNLGTLAILWLTAMMFVPARLQIDPQNPALSFAQHRIYRRRMGHAVGFMTLGLTVGMGLIGLQILWWPAFIVPFWLLMVLLMGPIIPLMVAIVASGQGGCKIKTTPETALNDLPSQHYAGRCDDKFWALGLFYHNPDDPAYIVEDRFGSNLGFNYAKLGVKIGVGALGLALVVMYVWVTWGMLGIL
ncbi:MAG: DUF1648 domain-containing protein, partial [Clostridia bacterium]|nr:DUF1648 domain-containing protein [Clostridia bacterium]